MTGADLRRHRERLGLSQSQLAEAFGVWPNTIARWERGVLPMQHPAIVIWALFGLESVMWKPGMPLPPDAN